MPALYPLSNEPMQCTSIIFYSSSWKFFLRLHSYREIHVYASKAEKIAVGAFSTFRPKCFTIRKKLWLNQDFRFANPSLPIIPWLNSEIWVWLTSYPCRPLPMQWRSPFLPQLTSEQPQDYLYHHHVQDFTSPYYITKLQMVVIYYLAYVFISQMYKCSNPDIHDIHVCSFISSQVIKDFVATNHITCLCKLIYRYIFLKFKVASNPCDLAC